MPPYPGVPPTYAGYPWGPAPGLVYAGFGRRFGGYMLDSLILLVPEVVAFYVLFGSILSSWMNAVQSADQRGAAEPQLVLPDVTFAYYLLVIAGLSLLYYGVLVGVWGSTLGQRAVGVRVVRQEEPTRRLPLERAVLRAIVWWGTAALEIVAYFGTVAGLAALLALLWVAWDPRKQGLHDKLGGALVVRAVPVLPPGYGPGRQPYGGPPGTPPWGP